MPCLPQERMEGGKTGLFRQKNDPSPETLTFFQGSAACPAEPLGFLELTGDAGGEEVCLFLRQSRRKNARAGRNAEDAGGTPALPAPGTWRRAWPVFGWAQRFANRVSGSAVTARRLRD